MNYLAKRLGSMLVVAGLIILIACISAGGEQVRKNAVSITANETRAIHYYLHDNDIHFFIEATPSGSKADVSLLDINQLKLAMGGVQPKPLVEFKGVDEADFQPQHGRGLHVLLIRNTSEHGISVYITCISDGIQRDIAYMGIGTIALGLISLVAAKTWGEVAWGEE